MEAEVGQVAEGTVVNERVCTLVWEDDAGRAALYGADGTKLEEYESVAAPDMRASDIYGNDCDIVRVRRAETAGENCRIYVNWQQVNHFFDPDEWDCDFEWPEELGDEQWLRSFR